MSKWNNFLTSTNRSLYSQAHTHAILLEKIMLELPKGGTILEAGCGMAYLSRLLSDAGYQVTAGDLDEDVLSSAKSKVAPTQNTINFVKLDLLSLTNQFNRDQFDLIVHSGVMEHFPDDLIVQSFIEQKTIAKAVIFKVPNANSKLGPGHFGDERFLNNRHWIRLIKKAGYGEVYAIGGESTPNWSLLLPSFFHLYPKHNGSRMRNEIANYASKWRRVFSRHSIFLCR